MAKLSDAQKAEIVASYRLCLAEEFRAKNAYVSIPDFEKQDLVQQVEKDYKQFPDEQKQKKQKAFFDKLRGYVDFVNKNLLKGNKQ